MERPKVIRKDVPYQIRRLEKIGELKFKFVKDLENIDHYMDIYYCIYSKSWQKRESLGPTFHRDLAKIAAKSGWLRLAFLFLDDIPISTQFWIVYDGYANILKTVYDKHFQKYSPGKILTAEMIKYVIDHDNVEAFDYGQGDEEYKKDWAPYRRERKGLLIFNRNIKGYTTSIIERKILTIINKNKYLVKIKHNVSKLIS
jgi:CelD/BcsL family acetyltransferase involved in cellulose biosynthesis